MTTEPPKTRARLMTRAEAAPLLGMSPDTLKKLVAARVVPFTRPVGTNLVRFTDDDIAEYLAASKVRPNKPAAVITHARAPRKRP